MAHVVGIGRTELAFPLHLLDAQTLSAGDIPSMLNIVEDAARSPHGRSSVVFICPESQDSVVRDTLMAAVRALMDERIRGIRQISIKPLVLDDARLPQSYLGPTDAPLACFSIARLSCLTYAMALANICYRGMEQDFANWLWGEQPIANRTLEEGRALRTPLTEHGHWIEGQLRGYGYPWHYPLDPVTTAFDEFIRRCERLPEVDGH